MKRKMATGRKDEGRNYFLPNLFQFPLGRLTSAFLGLIWLPRRASAYRHEIPYVHYRRL